MQISTQTYFASFFEAKYWTNYVCIFIKKKTCIFQPRPTLPFFGGRILDQVCVYLYKTCRFQPGPFGDKILDQLSLSRHTLPLFFSNKILK